MFFEAAGVCTASGDKAPNDGEAKLRQAKANGATEGNIRVARIIWKADMIVMSDCGYYKRID